MFYYIHQNYDKIWCIDNLILWTVVSNVVIDVGDRADNSRYNEAAIFLGVPFDCFLTSLYICILGCPSRCLMKVVVPYYDVSDSFTSGLMIVIR